MRKLYALVVATATLNAIPAKACVDYWSPPTITVEVEYDNTFSEILIMVTNLYLFGGPNGAFCSCGVTTWTDMFSDIQYIAFVDSGTFDPVPGFAVWDASIPASSAWNNLQAGDWNGYIAEVVAPGISTGTPVELLIRATLPVGYTFNVMDTSISQTSLGTDEWSPLMNDLAFSHNSMHDIGSSPRTYTLKPLAFFDQVDALVTSVSERDGKDPSIQVFGQVGNVTVAYPISTGLVELRLSDPMGRSLLRRSWDGSPLELAGLSPGLVIVEVRDGGTRSIRKVPLL